MQKTFPVIDPVATGRNIVRLRTERGMTVRDLQEYFGFEEPQAIYKWQRGKSLPTVDNLYALGRLLGVPMEQILVPAADPSTTEKWLKKEQQDSSCCSLLLMTRLLWLGQEKRNASALFVRTEPKSARTFFSWPEGNLMIVRDAQCARTSCQHGDVRMS